MLPIGAEGMEKDGKFDHFNREIFVLDRRDLRGLKYGDRIPKPVVAYKMGEDKVPKPLEEKDAEAPYIFRPDDGLTRMLYGLDIWEGNWIEGELAREKRKIAENA